MDILYTAHPSFSVRIGYGVACGVDTAAYAQSNAQMRGPTEHNREPFRSVDAKQRRAGRSGDVPPLVLGQHQSALIAAWHNCL
jgi:hypothetical protein